MVTLCLPGTSVILCAVDYFIYRLNLFPAEPQHTMLVTIAAILFILWLLGIVGVYSIGSFIHILLVVAIIVVLIRVIQGRDPINPNKPM